MTFLNFGDELTTIIAVVAIGSDHVRLIICDNPIHLSIAINILHAVLCMFLTQQIANLHAKLTVFAIVSAESKQ